MVIVAGLLVFYLIFKVDLLIYIACGVGLISALISPIATYVNWFWMKLALVLGWVNTRILLGVIFFVFLFPIATLARFFVKDPLRLKKTSASYYFTRNHYYVKNDLKNPW